MSKMKKFKPSPDGPVVVVRPDAAGWKNQDLVMTVLELKHKAILNKSYGPYRLKMDRRWLEVVQGMYYGRDTVDEDGEVIPDVQVRQRLLDVDEIQNVSLLEGMEPWSMELWNCEGCVARGQV